MTRFVPAAPVNDPLLVPPPVNCSEPFCISTVPELLERAADTNVEVSTRFDEVAVIVEDRIASAKNDGRPRGQVPSFEGCASQIVEGGGVTHADGAPVGPKRVARR